MKINFKDFINEKKEDNYIPNKLPEYLYHLTLAKNYDNIKENGLDPKFSK